MLFSDIKSEVVKRNCNLVACKLRVCHLNLIQKGQILHISYLYAFDSSEPVRQYFN